MRGDDLNNHQTRQLFEQVSPMLNYLVRLRQRMVQCRFEGDDELFRAVRDAEMAVYELRQIVHRLECRGSMGERRPPR